MTAQQLLEVGSILLLGLASVMSPGIFVMTSAILLEKTDPLKRALAFAAAELIVLVPIGLFAGGAANFIDALGADLSRLFTGWFDIVGGVVLLLASAGVWAAREEVQALIDDPPVRRRKGRHGYGMAAVFGIGLYTMITNVTSLVPFILAAKDIGRLEMGVPVELVLFAVLLVFPMLPTIVPIGLWLALGPRAEVVTDRFQALLKAYAVEAAVIVALAVAIWMLWRGSVTLGWLPGPPA